MSVHLANEQGSCVVLSTAFWACAPKFAWDYGWISAGTVDPLQMGSARNWNGRYYDLNNGQQITAADAAALAAALHDALEDVLDDPDFGWLFGGEARRHVQALIQLGEAGAFRIY